MLIYILGLLIWLIIFSSSYQRPARAHKHSIMVHNKLEAMISTEFIGHYETPMFYQCSVLYTAIGADRYIISVKNLGKKGYDFSRNHIFIIK